MPKAGGTLSANTNAQVFTADLNRQTISVLNLSSTDVIYVEFGAAAATAASSASWPVFPRTALTLSIQDWPEIREAINLISTGTPSYSVRTS